MASAVPFARIGGRGKGVRNKEIGRASAKLYNIRCNPPRQVPRYCCSGCFGTILNVKRRKAWRGRHRFWLKSVLVSKSTATCQPTVTCHPNSKFLIPISRLLGRRALAPCGRSYFHRRDLSHRRKRPCPRCRQQPMQLGTMRASMKSNRTNIFHSLVLLHE